MPWQRARDTKEIQEAFLSSSSPQSSEGERQINRASDVSVQVNQPAGREEEMQRDLSPVWGHPCPPPREKPMRKA